MNTPKDIRWKQRFSNYKKALNQLTCAVTLSQQRPLSELEQQGLIQAFEYTHELSWNLLRDYLREQGNQTIYGSKDAIREAFNVDLIQDGEIWMDMIQNRNQTSHTYNLETAQAIAHNIISQFFPLFVSLQNTMQKLHDAS